MEIVDYDVKKKTLIEQKARLLKEYKSYEIDLAFALNDYEKGLITDIREKLAVNIKVLGAQIREMEAQEA